MKVQIKDSCLFRFKKFYVRHSHSIMKVGVDGVLIGAWGKVTGRNGLDIGSGCGLIALMAAQRNQMATVDAVDFHLPSGAESFTNFKRSPWSDRLNCYFADINEFASREENQNKYNFIISNPPFFSDGIESPSTPREKARHESSLSPAKLIDLADLLLSPGGTVSMILPVSGLPGVEKRALELGFHEVRKCFVADRAGKNWKRVMVQYTNLAGAPTETEYLYLKDAEGNYTDQYKKLTEDFYLHF